MRKLGRFTDPIIDQQFREIVDGLNNNRKLSPTLLNGVTNSGGGWETASYIKTASGIVLVSGLVNLPSGFTASSAIFTLPERYRPAKMHIFHMQGYTGSAHTLARVDVDASGNVISQSLPGGSGVWLSLSGISFIAEQ